MTNLLAVLLAAVAAFSPAPPTPATRPIDTPQLFAMPGIGLAEMLPGGRALLAPYLDGCGNVAWITSKGNLRHTLANTSRSPLDIDCGGCQKTGSIQGIGCHATWTNFHVTGESGRCSRVSDTAPCNVAAECSDVTSEATVSLLPGYTIQEKIGGVWTDVFTNHLSYPVDIIITSPTINSCGAYLESEWAIPYYPLEACYAYFKITVACAGCPYPPE